MNKSESITNVTDKPNNLIQKLSEVMGEVGYIPKNGFNEKHRYNYAREADVVDAIRDKLAKRNVMMFMDMKECNTREHKSQSGNTMYIADVVIEYSFVDGDTMEERKFTINGCGSDTLDKAIYKAMTGSEKYAIMKTFLIPTGDDPENENPEPKGNNKPNSQPTKQPAQPPKPEPPKQATIEPPKPASEAQRRKLFAMQKQAGMEQEDLKLLINQLTGKTSTADLTNEDIQKCFADLEVIIKAKESKEGADAQ